jgi:hypothetical protein
MKITEILEGTGIYKVTAEDLPEEQWFIREDDLEGKVQPLLHVCEREVMKREAGEYYACMTGRVWWNLFYGRYECFECEKKFVTDEELCMVWADGKGTGYEGHA